MGMDTLSQVAGCAVMIMVRIPMTQRRHGGADPSILWLASGAITTAGTAAIVIATDRTTNTVQVVTKICKTK